MELVKEGTAWVSASRSNGTGGIALQVSAPMLMNSNFDFDENYCLDGLGPLQQDFGLGAPKAEGQQ